MNHDNKQAQIPITDLLIVDTETFCTVDIKKAGAIKYAEHAELLLAGFLLNGKYDYYDYIHKPTFPVWVLEHIKNGGRVCAHNLIFDYCILKKHIPFLELEQCIDSQAIVAAHGLPLSLDRSTDALNLPLQKYAGGGRLIRKFCIPRKPSKYNAATRIHPQDAPKDWLEFRDVYLYADVHATQGLVDHLGVLTPREQQVWLETQLVNLQGIPIDTKIVKIINDKLFTLIDDESTKFIRITGLFPTQRDKILSWCKDNGLFLVNLQATTVEDAIKDPHTPERIREALLVRANVSHMSFKKLQAVPLILCRDGTIKGTLMYHVAGTGRYGGRLFQPQNLTKGNIDGEEAIDRIYKGEFSIDLVKSSVRPIIYHKEGFSIVDYSSIEARIAQWVARDEEALDVFRQGKDPYIHMASKIYNVAYKTVTDKQRFTGKQAILGLGYSMSAKKFKLMVENYGEHIELAEATLAVSIYRKTHRKLVNLWKSLNSAAVMAVQRPGKKIQVNRYVSFLSNEEFLCMILPSNRILKYYLPEITVNSWGELAVTYMSMNEKNQYVRTTTYGGKLTENLVQATARDILTEAISRLYALNFKLILHVHDEIVVLGQNRLQEMEDSMCELPEWAAGLPIEAKGFTSMRFKK